MFKNINNIFLIKSHISHKKLLKCILFITKQSSLNEIDIKRKYNKSLEKFIKIPKNINIKNVDLIIKTKINNDYKFINIEKSLIFNLQKKLNLNNKKISKYKLKNIPFFPQTYISRNVVKQNLAKGTNRVPKKISEFNSFLLSSVAIVINNLSSKNNEEIKVNKYLNNFKFLNQKNIQKKKIINSLLLILKNYKNEKIITALTHGDFKCEHLFMLNNKLEYVIDWENISCRSIFFDLFNYFIPWFVHRSYNYFKIKIFILEFLKTYLPYLLNYISDKYDLYFSIFALERYLRMHNHKTLEFETKHKAYKRYDKLFGKLINDIKYKY